MGVGSWWSTDEYQAVSMCVQLYQRIGHSTYVINKHVHDYFRCHVLRRLIHNVHVGIDEVTDGLDLALELWVVS